MTTGIATVSPPVALPAGLLKYAGRLTDVDTHEMVPAQIWTQEFGDIGKELAEMWMSADMSDAQDKGHPSAVGYAGDIAPIDSNIVNIKGCRAPGAVDMNRRLQVMDAMGINKQLMFPTSLGLWSMLLLMNDKYDPDFFSRIRGDRAAKARLWLDGYNKWMIKKVAVSDRVRPVPPVFGDTVAELTARTKALIDSGIRAIWLSSGALPGGKSPAHPDLDAFWNMLVETKCVLTLHLGTEGPFLESLKEWGNAPAFKGFRSLAEFKMDPWYLSMMHVPVQNFISTMITGGVFERHPDLRLGVIEYGAYWVGPMAESLDLWYKNVSSDFAIVDTGTKPLSSTPSTYLKKNVRVSVFPWESIDEYIERYGLEDVLCFATDYPHPEGGKDALNVMYKKLQHLGEEVLEKFFVKNGEFLLPD